jgi:excisionase family DNA binding protein
MTAKPDIKPELLNVRQLARLLCISESTIRRKVEARQIPHYKIDSMIRFKRKEIMEFLETFRVDTAD